MVRLKNVLRYGCHFITRGYFGIAVVALLLLSVILITGGIGIYHLKADSAVFLHL